MEMETQIDFLSEPSKNMNTPITLKFKDVTYKVKMKNKKHAEGKHKTILKGITGAAFPGEILAMLGPSGSGKTTLLTALGGRLEGDLSGTITYNGRPYCSATKRSMGFVAQSDVLYPHLTVRETLVYSARLRLPSSLSKGDRVSRAESVITQLGLRACADSIIGGPFLRGVSGGERKRVSIGEELLMDPVILFLDEPTTGLDSTTAQRIVSTLSKLAKVGRTVVMTVHQPSSRLFYMFERILVVSDGHTIYWGKGAQVLDYFSSIGHTPSLIMNPADFLLDLANGVSSCGSKGDRTSVLKQALVAAYDDNIRNKLEEDLQDISDSSVGTHVHGNEIGRWATTWSDQFVALLQRDMKEKKHQAFSPLRIVRILAVAFLMGLLWWRSGVINLRDQTGLLMFTSGFWCIFGAVQAIFTFPLDRTMLIKERESGMYRLSAYFTARMTSELPLQLTLPAAFITISYWMGGLKPTARSFSEALFIILLEVLATIGLGLAMGAFIKDLKSAVTLGSVITLSSNLVGGYYVQHIPSFIAWAKYLSISHHTYKLLVGTQYTSDQTYMCGPNNECLVRDFPSVKAVRLDKNWVSVLILCAMVVGFRLIAYIGLMGIGVKKTKTPSRLASLKFSCLKLS
ncbi:hypothetical protein AAC387_Pa01g3035 [Persea americana]